LVSPKTKKIRNPDALTSDSFTPKGIRKDFDKDVQEHK
jgi:hypothetical protein